ncbi:MAG: glucose-1-phosphate adenylyltransferase [Deltaproteobacteria bacterium]|nr:glucose-1-phosphate adenylyltransferase [Deltaproteobacteria bacterium]MBW1935590.1 glucose-1-phosphate adenylyltransferase [Deltaproteobacteria bacterium]MBW1978850.1 glucose-1-phosphate adenylyltransferase [Deltaproteobacteria bacterium]MBW2044659.1 glucose-1-phosphate adenylyltransferase [Deltaproteobacteria bacterium]MBW2300835.1 glucose-1-phosphate adenylyltransferase [Deltaproteobacteria bacterium]
MRDTIAFVMAGGRGARLMPLTGDRSKPAVPFGGIYRLIDFTLSNCINSGLYQIVVLPQYKSQSLTEHLEAGWNIFNARLGHFLRIVPPQQRVSLDWYRGTADSVRQNTYLIERTQPSFVLILSGDHIYKMDYNLFLDYHVEKEADLTVSLLEVGTDQAIQFGVAGVDSDYRITGFQEKPQRDVKTVPGDSTHILASMGIYLFKTEVLLEILNTMKGDDFGRDIIPSLLNNYRVFAYPYRKFNRIEDEVYVTLENGERQLKYEERTRDSSYWRDVGTLDAYWNANMDLTGVDPHFNLYGRRWSIHTCFLSAPPAKFVFSTERKEGFRVGKALDSLVAPGCIVSGIVRNSVLSYNVIVRSWATVEESVLLPGVVVGRHCQIKKCIIDKDNVIPSHTRIGYEPLEDQRRFTVTKRGITVVPKGHFRAG